MRRLAFLLVLVAGLGLATVAHAQGTLRGVVTDSLDANTLPGANVFLEGTALGAATDIGGAYRIAGIPSGDYTVRVSYVGYQTKYVPVTIARGETVTLDVALRSSAALGEVVVSGQLEGQRAAINQQLASNTIVNVVSEEKIQELPDANAAESIGRLPGVSVQRSGGEASEITLRGLSGAFTNVTVDGIQLSPTDPASRSVDLSTISQGSLAGIELFKALTPDRDGDAIAGSVNLVTRRAPETRQLRVDVLGAYNELAGDVGQYDADFRYGERFFGGVLGVQLSGNLERRNRSNEQYDPDYDCSASDYTACQIEDLSLDYTDEIRQRRGGGAILDVSTPDGGFVKASGLYNQTSRDYITYSRNFPLDGDLLLYTARDREQSIRLLTGALTGENHLLGFDLDWGGSYSGSTSDFPFDYEINFTEPSLTEGGTVVSGMRGVPDSVSRGGDPAAIIPYALSNFEKTYFYSAFFRDERSTDDNLAGYLNVQRSVAIGTGIRATVRAGGKYRSRGRSRDRSEFLAPYYNQPFPTYIQLADGTLVPKDFTGTSFENLARQTANGVNGTGVILSTNFLGNGDLDRDLFDRFTLTPVLDRDLLREWYSLNQNGYSATRQEPEYEENLEPAVDYYDITERVSAGYVMSTVDIGYRVTLLGGVRVEREDNDYASRFAPRGLNGVPVPSGSIRDTSSTYAQTIWLPNAQAVVRPTDFLTVRLAAYRALARPDFNNRLANAVARNSGFFFPGNSITLGNPNLRSATAWNYEANVSFFGPRLGLFSVSAFYKDISDYFQQINGLSYTGSAIFDSLGIDYQSPFGDAVRFQLRAPYNLTQPTTVYGVEVEHQTSLAFLPGPLSGLVLGYNFSVVRSNTFIPRVRVETVYIERPPFPPVARPSYVPYEEEQKLQEQPDFFANVSLGYDFRSFSARASLFHQSAYNTSFAGSTEFQSDNLRGGYTRLDLAFTQAIGDRLRLLLNLNNLTRVEEQAIRYVPYLDRTLVNRAETYGTTVDLGLRLTL